MEQPEIATVGTKGQIVIPQHMRRVLRIRPKTKLAVYRKGDKLVMAKLEIPSLIEDLKDLFEKIDEHYKGQRRPTEREILAEIQEYRKQKRTTRGT